MLGAIVLLYVQDIGHWLFLATLPVTLHYFPLPLPVHCGSVTTGLPGSLLPFCNTGLPF